jgi:hypothetical protein
MSDFMKICPVRAELFHADRQTAEWTDTMGIILAFHNFVDTLKKYDQIWEKICMNLTKATDTAHWTVQP